MLNDTIAATGSPTTTGSLSNINLANGDVPTAQSPIPIADVNKANK
jgi:hypothetical protein